MSAVSKVVFWCLISLFCCLVASYSNPEIWNAILGNDIAVLLPSVRLGSSASLCRNFCFGPYEMGTFCSVKTVPSSLIFFTVMLLNSVPKIETARPFVLQHSHPWRIYLCLIWLIQLSFRLREIFSSISLTMTFSFNHTASLSFLCIDFCPRSVQRFCNNYNQ